jgi:hypothetical protein
MILTRQSQGKSATGQPFLHFLSITQKPEAVPQTSVSQVRSVHWVCFSNRL